ncbi:MAG: ABC transporter ATP-binding protein [Candidatus Omnitrophota bacterium]
MLRLENISCGYKEKIILNDLSFEFKSKKIVGIIGPNGSGKTTLLRAITKVVPLLEGNISFEGKDISVMSYREIARYIAVANSDIEAQFDISVEDFVALGRIPHQQPLQLFENSHDLAAIEEALQMTEMISLRTRPLRSLSAGERQMAIIAKALAQEPRLLLLDEPVVHLDISHQGYILDLISRLHREKDLSVIIVLHELNLASEYCDELILLDKGRVVKSGDPHEVIKKQIIEAIYKTEVVMAKNPVSGKPCVFISAKEQNRG